MNTASNRPEVTGSRQPGLALEASETERVPCNLCGADDAAGVPRAAERLVLPRPLDIVRCRQCGFMYVNPRLTRAAYAQRSLTASYHQSYQRGVRARTGPGTTARAQLERVERRYLQGGRPRGRLLEIGCATGAFLVEARQAGWQVFGVEPSPFMADEARRNGLKVAAELAPEQAGAFDVVHMHHVLEHVPEPAATLRGIAQVLAPTGLLVVEVPYEFGGWLFELYAALKPDFSKPNIHHLSFFTPRTLARALAGAGFAAEVKSSSPKQRTSRSALRRAGWTVLAYVSDAFNRGENIEAFAVPRAAG